jgi:hypothetical protein
VSLLPVAAVAGVGYVAVKSGALTALTSSISGHVTAVTNTTTASSGTTAVTPPSGTAAATTATSTSPTQQTVTIDQTPVYDHSAYPDAARVTMINNVYLSVLGRQVDPGGLATYYGLNPTSGQLAYILLTSPEYARRCTAPAVCSA